MNFSPSLLRRAALATLLGFAPGAFAQQEPIIKSEIISIAVGGIESIQITSGGSGYTTPPQISVSGGGGAGSGAVLSAVVQNGEVTAINILRSGTGFTQTPTLTIQAPGTTAAASATVNGGSLTQIVVSNPGSGYTTTPSVSITGGGGSNAAATATLTDGRVTQITITNAGSGYTSPPTITIDPPPGTAATAVVTSIGTLFSTPFQNESFGAVGKTIAITALASGTYLREGYTYRFYANGLALGRAENIPAGQTATALWAPPQPGSYLLTVEATDGQHTVTSLAVRYFAVGTSIVGPVDRTLVPNGSSVVIQATATPPPSGPNAFLQRIDFYVDGKLEGTDTTYPYSFIYTPAATPTTHQIEARGFDNNGNMVNPTASIQLSMVTPIGTPPIVRIVNPPSGSNVTAGTEVTFMTDAVAPDGFIKNVDFYVNGVLLSSSQRFPFTATWRPLVPGRYQFVSIAYDDKSNAVASAPIFVTATGAFPTASIVTPESGLAVVQGSIVPVTVRAAGPDGGVSSLKSIQLLVDGSVYDTLPKASTTPPAPGATPVEPVLEEPFVFNWRSNVAVGTHRLTARVTDKNNLSITSAEVVVSVVPNQAPQVALTAPTASSNLTVGVGSTLSASASDSDGSIDHVEFLAGGVSVGRATSRPFQVTWTPTTPGEVIITARATDNGGLSVTTPGVAVTVDPATSGGDGNATVTNTVYRGDYGAATESGRFAFAINRNGRGTFIGFSTVPTGRTYFWNDIAISQDGSFSVRDSANAVVLSGQTSATGISGQFGGRTFIGPITPASATHTPLVLSGAITNVPNSQVTAIVGGDGSITLYAAQGSERLVGTDFISNAGTFALNTPTGSRATGSVSTSAATVGGSLTGSVAGNFLLRPQASRITNISTRALAGSGDRTLLAGFVISGSGTKPLLVRAVGPTLVNFGINAPIADPFLNVVAGSSNVIASNNDWNNAPALATLFGQLGAFPLNANSRDAAVQATVPTGTFAAVVGGGGVPGPALIEIYDADQSTTANSRITNISTRGQVGVNDPMIAGFVITGDQRKRVLLRAVGPTLTGFGVTGALTDPRIEVLFNGVVVATNNDWTESAVVTQVTATSPAVGAFPLNANSRDAAMVLQLNPGAYSVVVRGVGSATGTALVEIYDADL